MRKGLQRAVHVATALALLAGTGGWAARAQQAGTATAASAVFTPRPGNPILAMNDAARRRVQVAAPRMLF